MIISHEKEILEQIKTKIINLSRDYHISYSKLIKNTKISFINNLAVLKGKNHLFIDNNQNEHMLVKFQETPSSIAKDINNNLHYIHSSRTDSFVDYGLFIDDDKVPYANVSFSKCKRNYQLLALNKAISANLLLSDVLVMTRAFAFDGAPKNSMSKLFHQSSKRIKKDYPEIKVIITAVNPYLGFSGGIFTGASYTPYALSPMEYWYNKKGYYVPRSEGIRPQRSKTPLIVWLAHGLDKKISLQIELINIDNIKEIDPNEYKKG